MRQGGEQGGVAKLAILGTRLDLDFHKTAVRPFNHRVDRVIVHQRHIHIEALFQHEAHDVILDAFAKSRAVTEADAHRSNFSAKGLVQQRFFQLFQRGELPLVDAREALGFNFECIKRTRDFLLLNLGWRKLKRNIFDRRV